MVPSPGVCLSAWCQKLAFLFALAVTASCQPGSARGNASPGTGQCMSRKHHRKISQLGNVEWKIASSFALGIVDIDRIPRISSQQPYGKGFCRMVAFFFSDKKPCAIHHLLVTALLPAFGTASLACRSQFIIDFAFLKFNLFFSSPLVTNEKRKGIFVFLLLSILAFTFCINDISCLLLKWVKLGLRLFWGIKHITITT